MIRLLLFLSLFLVLPCTAEIPVTYYPMPSRIVAVGDVHASYDNLVVLLKDRNLIDDKGDWIGGDAHLVFAGDLLHRGLNSYSVIRLIMKLEKQAKEKGGNVTAVLGNHDVMPLAGGATPKNMIDAVQTHELRSTSVLGDSYYSSAAERADYSSYATSTSLGPILSNHGAVKNSWPGYVAAFNAKDSDIAEWMRTRPAVVNIGGHIFAHAALLPEFQKGMSLEKINEAAQLVVTSFQEGGKEIPPNHPLIREAIYFKAVVMNAKDIARGKVAQDELFGMLTDLKAKTLSIGHVVTSSRKVEKRYEDKVFMIDTGMYVDRISAMEMIESPDGKTTVTAYNDIGTSNAKSVILACIEATANLAP